MPSLNHQWTIKSKRFDKELVTGCRLAAERQGMAMGDWCVETLRERSRAILKGDEAPAHPPPARIETTELAELVRGMAETQEQRLAQIARETRRGRWRR